jgi:hypothetical protein
LWAAVGLLAAASAGAAAIACRARANVGRARVVERQRRRGKLAMLAAIAATAVGVAVGAGELPRAELLTMLALCACVVASSPSFGDSILGERGVRRGWVARRFEQVEEWRLTGEHLRWKAAGEWLACRAPAELHGELREKLSKLCPGRESPFSR